ncbi:MAG: DUF2111 domain-containing protein [Methanomassiliicoccales archaeon]|nr:DUF2111 domain-containing protein [Methanomassiliicoccales archaeon]
MTLDFGTFVHSGPQPNYTLYHVWKCYTLILEHGPVGRRALATMMDLGEGSARTLLERMVKEGCVEFTRRGAVLTSRGREKFQAIGVKSIDFGLVELAIGKFNCAVLVKGQAGKVKDGTQQRDDAVRAGAESAIVLVARRGGVIFPTDDKYPDQDAIRPLERLFSIEDGDVLIIGGADNYTSAEKGAVSAALSLTSPAEGCWGSRGKLLSKDYEENDIKSIALMVHEIVGRLPVTMRSKNHFGVRCENGKIIETNFTGPVLEETLRKGTIIRRMSRAGKYRGCPVLAVPLIRENEVVAVVGVFDTTRGSYSEWLGRVRR